MKDMMGIELEAGQYVFYFRTASGVMIHEEAEVIKINPKTVRIEYFGNHSDYGKKKGNQGNIHNTTGRLFVLNKDIEKEKLALLEQIKNLTEQNNRLKAEIEKINNRWEILDL